MTREDFIDVVSSRLKLIRTEFGVTQEEMSSILGISKKTLVETEKRRRNLSWVETVAVATIFSRSNVLQVEFGGDANELINMLAFNNTEVSYSPTMGGKVWWKVILEDKGYRIQQNMVSNHYRLLDKNNNRLMSAFNFDDIKEYLDSIKK